jgi:hypothetical protein
VGRVLVAISRVVFTDTERVTRHSYEARIRVTRAGRPVVADDLLSRSRVATTASCRPAQGSGEIRAPVGQ